MKNDPKITGLLYLFATFFMWGSVYVAGKLGSALSQISWAKALSRFSASTCSLFYPLQAVFSTLLGALILHERFTASFFIGLLFVAADVALSTWAARREATAG